MITGTYNLTVNPQWINVQQQEVFLECDTTLAPVTINLFEIVELNRFWGVKIIISDANNNAGTNNITVNASGSDTVDDDTTNQIVINTNGSSVSFQVASETQWLAIESLVAGLTPTAPYKVYTALLTQTGTNPPVATVLENTLGVNLTFSYLAIGVYTINNLNGWDRTKLWYGISGLGDSSNLNINPGRVAVSIEGASPDMLIVCYNNDYSLTVDQQLVETPIEIRVYN